MLHLLYQHNQMILLKEPKTFYFDWPKDVGNNFPTTTTLRIDVNSTPILRSYVKKKISMYFHVVSMYFFNVISVGEKSTSFPHSLFQVILMRKKSRLFWCTLFDVISMGGKSTSFQCTFFEVILIGERSTFFQCTISMQFWWIESWNNSDLPTLTFTLAWRFRRGAHFQ